MTSGEVDGRDSPDKTGPDPLLLKFVEDAKGASSVRLETGRLPPSEAIFLVFQMLYSS